jgi:hypothetical protein
MKIHLNILIKKKIKEGPKFDTDDLFSLGIITFEVELAFSRFKERSKLIRNVQDIYNMHQLREIR